MPPLYLPLTLLRKPAALLTLMALFCGQPVQASVLQARQQEQDHLFDEPCTRYQVPKVLALAIARQESGYHPWILNISGRDVRSASKEEALRYAHWAMNAGRSFDVGLMQVNSYWIRKYGWSLEQVLEPANNVKIGVWILAQEIRRHGLNWKAVAYYHTPLHRNPERGRAYARTVVGHVKNILENK